jgi:hypothetical protein
MSLSSTLSKKGQEQFETGINEVFEVRKSQFNSNNID